jgi:hypothetical protein
MISWVQGDERHASNLILTSKKSLGCHDAPYYGCIHEYERFSPIPLRSNEIVKIK